MTYHSSDFYTARVFDPAMEPRYHDGELIFVHPDMAPDIGGDVVLVLQDDDGKATRRIVRRLIHRDGGNLTVKQFNPEVVTEIPEHAIKAAHHVMTMHELFASEPGDAA